MEKNTLFGSLRTSQGPFLFDSLFIKEQVEQTISSKGEKSKLFQGFEALTQNPNIEWEDGKCQNDFLEAAEAYWEECDDGPAKNK